MKLSLGKYLLPTYVALTFAFLAIPIIYTFVFSFNDSIKSNIIWRGFTLDNWLDVCNQQEVCDAFGNSVIVAVSATVVATILGTMIAIALVRYRFRFRSATNLLLFLPLATPEVVMGAGLAAQFLDFGWQKGLPTVIIAHTMFTLSFVVVTVKARVATLDPALEEAGRDLYANAAQVFWRITFPPPLLRRLHHHAVQFGCSGHLPQVRLHRSRKRHPRRGQRNWLLCVPGCYCDCVGGSDSLF